MCCWEQVENLVVGEFLNLLRAGYQSGRRCLGGGRSHWLQRGRSRDARLGGLPEVASKDGLRRGVRNLPPREGVEGTRREFRWSIEKRGDPSPRGENQRKVGKALHGSIFWGLTNNVIPNPPRDFEAEVARPL